MDISAKEFMDQTSLAAEQAEHPYPDMAAAEAALESGYGRSGLAIAGNNLFGMKQHKHPIYGTVNMPTREFLDGKWVKVLAPFIKYPTLRDCFVDRVATLKRLAPGYPHYAAALAATTPEQYVTEVSKSWATDPDRATKVISIYHRYMETKNNNS